MINKKQQGIRNTKKKFEPRYKYWERLMDLKKNPNKKKYFCFFLKKKNNVFITLTDLKGRVIITKSAGDCKIRTKKKKKSWDTLKEVANLVSKSARIKNIRYIHHLFISSQFSRNAKIIHKCFRENGLVI